VCPLACKADKDLARLTMNKSRVEEDFLLAARTNNYLKLKNLIQHGVNIDCVDDVSFCVCTLQLLLYYHAERSNCIAHLLFRGPR